MSFPTRRPACLLLLATLFASAACATPPLPDLPPAPMLPEPSPDEVETVIYLLGDPGETTLTSHPILLAMRRDIDAWAEKLPGDTTIAVLVLGDIIYPAGLHDPGHPAFAEDSVHVDDQVELVSGDAARQSAWAFFLAGNHDWGREEDWKGRTRLQNLDDLLVAFRARGYPVSMAPPPGEGGPVVVDLGAHVRLLLLDTAWWLLDAEDEGREAMLLGIDEAARTAGDRHLVLASHHPYQSAGSHGGAKSFWKGLGIGYALARAGAILQDLNSVPYRELRGGIRSSGLRHGPALIHAGGHDHSIQVIRGRRDGSPRYSVVVGSASKLTNVGHEDGLLFRRSWPGYARLFVLRDGGIILSVEGAPPEYLVCRGERRDRSQCMEEGARSYRTLWSDRLR